MKPISSLSADRCLIMVGSLMILALTSGTSHAAEHIDVHSDDAPVHSSNDDLFTKQHQPLPVRARRQIEFGYEQQWQPQPQVEPVQREPFLEVNPIQTEPVYQREPVYDREPVYEREPVQREPLLEVNPIQTEGLFEREPVQREPLAELPVQREPLFELPIRRRRQVTYPSDSPLQREPVQPAQPQSTGSSALSFLSELGPQFERAKSLASMFTSNSQQQQQQQPQQQPPAPLPQPYGLQGQPPVGTGSGVQPTQQPGGFGQQVVSALQATQLMSQLADMVRSSQERTAQTVAQTQQNLQGAPNQASKAAVQAQGGIQAALAEMGAGLQRLAANNPNLLPDIKNLYQSISSKLMSASGNVAQAATDGATPVFARPTQSPGDQLASAVQSAFG